MQPFRVDVADDILVDLADRLDRTRWPDQPDGTGWDDGTDLAYLRRLVEHWRHRYDWRAAEARLNAFDQYRAEVDGIGIHFLYQRGRGPDPVPLVVTHGWPSTYAEMLEIVPLLTDPGAHGGDPADSFDVVVPSLPGYGFSDRPEPGVVWRLPELWVRLMVDVLGYPRFAAHGVDIGAFLTNRLGLEHPDRLLGIHVTQLAEPSVEPGSLTDEERRFVADRTRGWADGAGYSHLQGTRPQTLSYGLTDSPVGLAAWIVEKWRSWSDCGGDLTRRFSADQLLTTVMIYWVTGTIGSSIRLYKEWGLNACPLPGALPVPDGPPGADSAPPLPPGRRIETPTGVALFLLPGQVGPPRSWIERAYNLHRLTRPPRGGHFPALEEPELLVDDIRSFFRPLRQAA